MWFPFLGDFDRYYRITAELVAHGYRGFNFN